MEYIKTATDGKYEVSDETCHTLECIMRNCEKLVKAYEKKLEQREEEWGKSLNR